MGVASDRRSRRPPPPAGTPLPRASSHAPRWPGDAAPSASSRPPGESGWSGASNARKSRRVPAASRMFAVSSAYPPPVATDRDRELQQDDDGAALLVVPSPRVAHDVQGVALRPIPRVDQDAHGGRGAGAEEVEAEIGQRVREERRGGGGRDEGEDERDEDDAEDDPRGRRGPVVRRDPRRAAKYQRRVLAGVGHGRPRRPLSSSLGRGGASACEISFHSSHPRAQLRAT